ncbi:MAG: methylated-DNA--[protein]-cysteine S-methyltransferase [Deltaproteobacteria bacterium]|nr:methylated-DNA--[protein]-cysteine S-methyltransferase [Deltaproteobacteria bacterium]MBW2129334.1 methylated-DNA--[protein]-cysteine S-methyltransferase [Deltaproteobacteria bacterium]MBW2303295.1 methylated-DNA--[protein]-cysteine S-methyltransferase [Deltaproteobacteria bacterium]
MFKISERESRENRYVYSRIQSPVGPLTLVAGDRGLRGLLFQNTSIRSGLLPNSIEMDSHHEFLVQARVQLGEYFDGTRREFDLPLAYEGTPFQRRVWKLLMKIPYGETVSYGDIAAELGDPRKARPVGGAVGANPIGIIIPCHRVIGKDGSLTGFGGGLDVKTFLLDLERRNKA